MALCLIKRIKVIRVKREEYLFLPTASNHFEINAKEEEKVVENTRVENEIVANALCPCCGNKTIPSNEDALAYICPICFWEIDLFIKSDNEPSDQNHGLTLAEARQKYKRYGAVLPYLKKYCKIVK